MDHLDDIDTEELHSVLDSVGGSTPAQRLTAAIAYKNGVTQTELAEWYGTERRTIYNWLTRFDTDEPLEQAATDDHRPGRNRKLSESQLAAFERAVHRPPEQAGVDARAWTPALVQQYLDRTHDVAYSIPSYRRLLREAGVRYQGTRWVSPGADDR